MRLVDADKIVFYYGGLYRISPYDFMGIAKYFADQIKAVPTVPPPPNDPLTSSALEAVRAERQRQDALWGDQSGNSLFEWMSILGEEYGELCEAVNETCCKNPAHPDRGGYENIIKEATQVAAVALEIIEAAYRRKPEETNNGITTLR